VPEGSLEILKPRALARGRRGWRTRLRNLAPLRPSVRAAPASSFPRRRHDRHEAAVPARRWTLRSWPRPRLVREVLRTLVHRHTERSTASPPLQQPAPIAVREHRTVVEIPGARAHEGVRAIASRDRRRDPPPERGSRSLGVLHDLRRIERLVVGPGRERTRVERIQAPAVAATAEPRATAAIARPVAAASTAAPAARAAASRAGARHAPLDGTAQVPPRAAALEDTAAPPAAGRPEPPDVDEIAERVIRLIERRARAQRERLGLV
jgi:hypothetical protein